MVPIYHLARWRKHSLERVSLENADTLVTPSEACTSPSNHPSRGRLRKNICKDEHWPVADGRRECDSQKLEAHRLQFGQRPLQQNSPYKRAMRVFLDS